MSRVDSLSNTLRHGSNCTSLMPSSSTLTPPESTKQPVGNLSSFQVTSSLQPRAPGTQEHQAPTINSRLPLHFPLQADTMCTFDRPIDAMGHPLVSHWRRNSRGCPKGGTCPEATCRHQDILTKNPLQICEHCKRWADQYIDHTGGQGSRQHHSLTEIPASA
jgi:hypothetical protein